MDRECPWLVFQGVRLAARLVREVIYKKTGEVRSTLVVYLLTSLPLELATPEHLLRWSRTGCGTVPCHGSWRRSPT